MTFIIYVLGAFFVLSLLGHIVGAINRFFSPAAAERYRLQKASEREEQRLRREAEQLAAYKAEEARRADEIEQQNALRAREELALQLARQAEMLRQEHRDAHYQDVPYTYVSGLHANEALAIRYGIANEEMKKKEYIYFAKGGQKKYDKTRDSVYKIPAKSIRLQKIKRLRKDHFLVKLTDHRDREAIAVIESGMEYVKTFYPMDNGWFERNEFLEKTLKGNSTFTLKELATFHVQKAM